VTPTGIGALPAAGRSAGEGLRSPGTRPGLVPDPLRAARKHVREGESRTWPAHGERSDTASTRCQSQGPHLDAGRGFVQLPLLSPKTHLDPARPRLAKRGRQDATRPLFGPSVSAQLSASGAWSGRIPGVSQRILRSRVTAAPVDKGPPSMCAANRSYPHPAAGAPGAGRRPFGALADPGLRREAQISTCRFEAW
jgi:hypothetical protein